jgi:hypothetical protein
LVFLITIFQKLRVVAGRSRTRAGCPHAVSGRPKLIHTHHAVPLSCPLRGRFQNGIFVAWQANGMGRHGMCESNMAALCQSNGKTQSKPLAERDGRGTAWYVWIGLYWTIGVVRLRSCVRLGFSIGFGWSGILLLERRWGKIGKVATLVNNSLQPVSSKS